MSNSRSKEIHRMTCVPHSVTEQLVQAVKDNIQNFTEDQLNSLLDAVMFQLEGDDFLNLEEGYDCDVYIDHDFPEGLDEDE